VLAEIGAHLQPIERQLILSTNAGMLGFQGRFIELEQVLNETELSWVRKVELAPEEYYFMDPATHGLSMRMALQAATGRNKAFAKTCDEVIERLESIGPIGSLICMTMMIYSRYVAADWDALPSDLARFDATVSRIEGAAHYRNLSRLVAARMRTRAGDRAALDEVAEVMGGAEVEFALQHLPRYQMIAGDAHADVGDAETARAYYAQSLKGGPCGSQQWLRSEVLCRLGSLAAGVGSAAEAERLFVDALQTAQTQGASLFELRAALALARSGGDEALGALEKICDRLEEGGPDVVAARKLLAERAGPRRKLARRR
jgi:hypothetical protein